MYQMVLGEGGGILDVLCQNDRYTLIEQSSNSRIACMKYSQKNFLRIIGNDQKDNGQNFWEILERIIGKISSIIGAGLQQLSQMMTFRMSLKQEHFYNVSSFHGST